MIGGHAYDTTNENKNINSFMAVIHRQRNQQDKAFFHEKQPYVKRLNQKKKTYIHLFKRNKHPYMIKIYDKGNNYGSGEMDDGED